MLPYWAQAQRGWGPERLERPLGAGPPEGAGPPKSFRGWVESSLGDVDGPLGAWLGYGGRAQQEGWAGGGGAPHRVGVVRLGRR